MTAIVEPDQAQLSILQAMLHGSVACTTLEDLGAHLGVSSHEFAVVVGPSIPIEDATTFAQWARVNRPDLGVILLRHEVNSAALSTALRSGMREVVDARDLAGVTTAVQRARSVASAITEKFDAETQAAAEAAAASAMAEAEARAAQARAAAAQAAEAAAAAANAPKGKVVTVFSTKGGVGKTVVATNVAVALSETGATVCLIDLDVNNGDVAIMLQLQPTRNINDLAAFGGVIDDGSVRSILTKYSEHLSVVAAPVSLDSPDKASPEDIGKLIEALREQFDHVVIDTAGVFDDNALAALDRSDRIVLVGTLDIPSLKGLKLAVSTLDLLNFGRNTWTLLLNRADGKVGLSPSEFETTLGLKVDHSLVTAREVLTAVNRGEPLVRSFANHQNSKALRDLAKSLIPAKAPGVPAQKTATDRKAVGSRLRLRKG